MSELLAFPASRHDDQVDAIVQALAHDNVEKGGVCFIDIGRRHSFVDDFWRRHGVY